MRIFVCIFSDIKLCIVLLLLIFKFKAITYLMAWHATGFAKPWVVMFVSMFLWIIRCVFLWSLISSVNFLSWNFILSVSNLLSTLVDAVPINSLLAETWPWNVYVAYVPRKNQNENTSRDWQDFQNDWTWVSLIPIYIPGSNLAPSLSSLALFLPAGRSLSSLWARWGTQAWKENRPAEWRQAHLITRIRTVKNYETILEIFLEMLEK